MIKLGTPGVRTPEHAPLRCKRSLGAGHGAGRFLFPWSEWTVPDWLHCQVTGSLQESRRLPLKIGDRVSKPGSAPLSLGSRLNIAPDELEAEVTRRDHEPEAFYVHHLRPSPHLWQA